MKKVIIGLIVSIAIVYGVIGIIMLLDHNRADGTLVLEYRTTNNHGITTYVTQNVPLFYNSDGVLVTRANNTRFLPSNTFSRVGHSFVGWTMNGDNVVAGSYIPAGLVIPAENNGRIVIESDWGTGRNYTIQFNSRHGNVANLSAIPWSFNQTFDISGLVPGMIGESEFIGWFTAASGGTQIYFTDQTLVQRETLANIAGGGSIVTLYGRWTAPSTIQTITFHANGGQFIGGSITNTHSLPIERTTPFHLFNLSASQFIPTHPSGYRFWGWNFQQNGERNWPNGTPQDFFMLNTPPADFAIFGDNRFNPTMLPMWGVDQTLYAIWSPNTTYTITFYANGGAFGGGAQTNIQFVSASNNSGHIGQGVNRSVNFNVAGGIPTRAGGYRFLGWALFPESTSVRITNGTETFVRRTHLPLYAVWGR